MNSMTKKLILLITSLLLVVLVLSACGLDSFESNAVSDAARQAFIDKLLTEEGVEILYAPVIVDEEGEHLYNEIPSGYTKVSKSKGSTTGLSDMYQVLKNDDYELYIDFKTTDIAVLDLKTGFSYHSNPDRDPSTTLSDSQQSMIGSPLSVEAYDASGKRYSFNFYDNCYEEGEGAFYVVKTGKDSIRLIYTIGNDPDKELFPPVITQDTYENVILDGLADKYREGVLTEAEYLKALDTLDDCYRFITPNPEDKKNALSAEDKERFEDTFPHIDVMSMYISYDKVPVKQKGRVKTIMETIGFTVQDVKREMEKADYQGPERSVLYTIPVDLVLNEDGLSVNLDMSLILGPTKQRLYSVNVYRGLGATKAVYDGGYMIVPDGSGSVIPAAGNLGTALYKARLYGTDGAFMRSYDADYSQQNLAPYLIFDRGNFIETSTSYNGGGIIALMEEGAGQASVVARPVQGTYPVSSINYEVIYSERDYRTYTTSLTAGMDKDLAGSGLLLSKDDVTGTYRIQYLFTEGGMTYGEYATYLREYFMKKGMFPKDTLQEKELPFFIDLIGCIDVNETVLGVPVKSKTPLTTYNQALEILSKLKESGINNVVARYSYWANGGENNVIAKDLELLDCMGSKGELNSLIQYCNDNGMGFFPSVEFLYVTSTGNGFSESSDAARRMNRSAAKIVDRLNANGSLRNDLTRKILISSNVSTELAESYKASFEKVLGANKSIAMGILGEEIHSNYKENNGVSRLWAEKDHIKILDTFKKDGYKIAVSTGNFYTWNYATHIFDLPTGSSEYLTASSAIPFTQIMLHGYVNYSMEALNKTGDYETALLLALETGSAFSFRWMGEKDSVFDYTEFYNYFSLNYSSTFERAVEIYQKAADVLNDVVNEPITDHMELNAFYGKNSDDPDQVPVVCDGVFATVYGSKKVVIVNYNSHDVTLENGTVVNAKSYVTLKYNEFKNMVKEG